MQIICTSLQTDNHASTSSLNFCRLVALPDAKPTEYFSYKVFALVLTILLKSICPISAVTVYQCYIIESVHLSSAGKHRAQQLLTKFCSNFIQFNLLLLKTGVQWKFLKKSIQQCSILHSSVK